MKQIYILITLFFIVLTSFSQNGYEFALQHNSGYNFSVVAIPNFDATNTDVQILGFAILLPTGIADVTTTADFNGLAWTIDKYDSATLLSLSVGDGTKDGLLFSLDNGSTILSHSVGVPIVLTNFDISNSPTTGEIEIIGNDHPIAVDINSNPTLLALIGQPVENVYFANIDNTVPQNYFKDLAAGQGTFLFSTLNTENEIEIEKSITLYPNPVRDILHLRGAVQSIKTVEVYSIIGQLVDTFTNNLESINISDYNSSIYILKANTENGSQIIKFFKL